MLAGIFRWIDVNILALGREMRLSYLPPLMVYVADGISGLTGIVGTFFVKDYLGLSAAFLAALGFWAGIPWALKMPLGHLVDLIWRWKSWLVLPRRRPDRGEPRHHGRACSPTARQWRAIMPAEAWFVLSTLLAPVGYVIQDVVADAMTVEAVPRVDENGKPVSQEDRKLMNTTMQTLGRVAIIGGLALVAVDQPLPFDGVDKLCRPRRRSARLPPGLSQRAGDPADLGAGVAFAWLLKRRELRRLAGHGMDAARRRASDAGQNRERTAGRPTGGSSAAASCSSRSRSASA